MPPAPKRDLECFHDWLARLGPGEDKSKTNWAFGRCQLQCAAAQQCIGLLLVANDLRSDPAVCSLARVVRENKGVIYSAPPEALAEVCGLAGRLRRPVSELEEDVWAA